MEECGEGAGNKTAIPECSKIARFGGLGAYLRVMVNADSYSSLETGSERLGPAHYRI